MNRIKNEKFRDIEFNILVKFVLKDLQDGWNPEAVDPVTEQTKFTLIESLRFGKEFET